MDPDVNYMFWHSSQIENGLNCFSYKNEIVDSALVEGRKTFDLQKRKEIYNRFQEAFIEDPPGILLYYPFSLLAGSNKIQDIEIRPRDIFRTVNQWDINN
jgi:peptide/nickel transport system substrate-binding protein